MSKIYEALRRHEQEPVNEDSLLIPREESHAPLQEPLLAPRFDTTTETDPSPIREMQALYRSIDSALAGRQGGAMIMISSSHPGEGKTTLCVKFADALAHSLGKSVLILDADRNHTSTRHSRSQKASSVALLEKSPEAILQGSVEAGERGAIAAVTVGSPGASALAPRADMEVIARVRDRIARIFDYILIDAPSVAEASWSPSFGAIADGVILVVEAERTRWPVVQNTRRELERSGAKVLGVFLNRRRFYIPESVYRRV